jgi:CBS domain containing-hemolysin-like protein
VIAWWEIAGGVACALASFFFALAESALFALTKWQTRQLVDRHPVVGARVTRLLSEPWELLGTLVLGNVLSNAGVIGLSAWAVFEQGWSWGAKAGLMGALLVVVLVGCEVVPKTLAVRAPDRWSVWVAAPLDWLQRLSWPLRRVAQGVNAVLLQIITARAARKSAELTDEEYRELLEVACQAGAIAQTEKEVLAQIIQLDRRTVREVMRPRSQMACISDELSVEEMIEAARRFKHRRLPVYDETPDTIVGILNTRTLLLDPQVDLAEAIEFPSFVPESTNLLRLLTSLQRQRRGMAMVLDEFGGTAGLVTLEDILEAAIGEIRSEGREEGFLMEKLAEGSWRVNANMRIDDFARECPELGYVEEVETMGGLLTMTLGVVPVRGESAVVRGLRLTATLADERRVRELLVEAQPRKGGR